MNSLRVATPEDAPAIMRVHVDSIRALGPAAYDDVQVAAWAEKGDPADHYPIERDDHHLVVAERGNRIVGYGHLVPENEEVRAVYVHPDAVRDGVGSAILAHLEGYALGVGIEHLRLWASLNAVEFYERRGYYQTAETVIEKEYDGRNVPLTVVAMEKRIDG